MRIILATFLESSGLASLFKCSLSTSVKPTSSKSINNALRAKLTKNVSPFVVNGSGSAGSGAGAAGTDDKDVILAKATQQKYDYIHLVGASADGWTIHNLSGTWSDES